MKVIVSRTSIWGDEKPIENAVKGEVAYYDYRLETVAKNPSAWDQFVKNNDDIIKLPDGSYRGTNKNKSDVWFIDVDDVFEFVSQLNESVIVKPSRCVEGYIEIEIYDDYRE